jgi:hypothetical protein
MEALCNDTVEIRPLYDVESVKQTPFIAPYLPKEDVIESDISKYGEDDEEFLRLLVESSGRDSGIWRWPAVSIEDWLLGQRYLNLSGIIRKAVYDDICAFFKTVDGNPWNRLYNEAWFEEGIGSGKSYKTSCIATYFQHLLLCLREPQRYFGIDKSSKIAIMNMSVSERNAIKVIFSEIKSKIDTCVWFNERPWERDDARMPDPNCLSELKFKNNTFIRPGSSSWRTAVGYHILVGIIDEAGSYRKTDNSDQAGDIYNALQRRLGSRFESKGAIIGAGSPMYENDFLEDKIKEGEDPQAKVYAKRRSLWDSKYPDWKGDFFYVDRVQRIILDAKPSEMKDVDAIPMIPFLFKAFRANVTKAYRDFGAKASSTINGFFENPKILLERFNRHRETDPVDALGRFKPSFKCIDKQAFYAIHVDLALSGDACGFALGHHAGTTTDEGATIVYIDLMMRIKGSPEAPIRISKIREIIFALQEMGFPIKNGIVTYDGFQSSDSLQILESKGYNVENLSVDRTTLPYCNLKEAINENRLDYYYVPSGDPEDPSASQVFITECSRLEEIEGKKIDHPPKGSKDVADAVAGVVHNIIEKASYVGKVQVAIL